MRNILTLRREVKELETVVMRTEQVETELEALATRESSQAFLSEVDFVRRLLAMPERLDEAEARMEPLRTWVTVEKKEEPQPRPPEVVTPRGRVSAGHTVLVSHAADDKGVADSVCASLESRGIRCWLAHRDVYPGQNWAEAIIDAINASRIMVLILSGSAANSTQVLREIERAAAKEIPIIAFRVEDVRLTDSFEYFLSSYHWLDATNRPFEACVEQLAGTVERRLLQQGNRSDSQNKADSDAQGGGVSID
jgi:hypothetical protein